MLLVIPLFAWTALSATRLTSCSPKTWTTKLTHPFKMPRRKLDGSLWEWGKSRCKRCNVEFCKTAPRASYCHPCRKTRQQERDRERYTTVCGGATIKEIQRRMIAASEAKAAGIDVMLLMDVMDGIKEDDDVSDFLFGLTDLFTNLPKVEELSRSDIRKRLAIKNRNIKDVSEEEVLFVLIWNDLEREIARKVGEQIGDREVTLEDLTERALMLFVDEEVWLEEPNRLSGKS